MEGAQATARSVRAVVGGLMIKILHSADWQIGLRAKHVANVAEAVRGARLDAARNVIQSANRLGVNAVVLAGDIFEDTSVGDRLVHQVVTILAESRVPVYVLPGNHDPLTPDAVYLRASWRQRPEHVRMLDTSVAVPVPGTDAVLLPAPLRQKTGLKDPTSAWIQREEADGIRIGVAHGSLRIEGKHSPDDFPIALDAVARSGLDYLALGHWHGQYIHGERTAYSGAHETTKFGEDGSGQALMVEIPSRGALPQLTPVPTRSLTWRLLELDLNQGTELEAARVHEHVAGIKDPARTLLRLRTTGASSDEDTSRLAALEESLWGKGFLHIELDRRDVARTKAEGRLAELSLSSGLLATLLEQLGAQAVSGQTSAPDVIRPAARQLLSELVMEVWK